MYCHHYSEYKELWTFFSPEADLLDEQLGEEPPDDQDIEFSHQSNSREGHALNAQAETLRCIRELSVLQENVSAPQEEPQRIQKTNEIS